MKKKHLKTRHALLMSCISLMTCFAMLLGATFAWFTDSVTSGVNRIVAGNLDVELYHKTTDTTAADPGDAVTGETKLFNASTNTATKLWEPGAMAYETFTVKNVGSLSLDYKLQIGLYGHNTVLNADSSDSGNSLLQVLRVAVIDGTPADLTREGIKTAATSWVTLGDFVQSLVPLPGGTNNVGTLTPAGSASGDSKTFTLAMYWPSDAETAISALTGTGLTDNDFNLQNGKRVSDATAPAVGELWVKLGVTLVATQHGASTNDNIAEADSFGYDYDLTATYPVMTQFVSARGVSNTAFSNTKTGDDTPTASTEALEIVVNNGSSNIGSATVPQAAASSVMDAIITNSASIDPIADSNAAYTKDELVLTLNVETVDTTETSVTLDVSMDSLFTRTEGDTEASATETLRETGSVSVLSQPVTVTLNLEPGLDSVTVKHSHDNGTSVTTTDMALGTSADALTDGQYYYDSTTGVLTLKTSQFSEFAVSFKRANVVENTTQHTAYGSLNAALATANASDVLQLNASVSTGTIDKAVTLNLNGKDATGIDVKADVSVHGDGALSAEVKTGTLTITGGKHESVAFTGEGAVIVTGGSYREANVAAMTEKITAEGAYLTGPDESNWYNYTLASGDYLVLNANGTVKGIYPTIHAAGLNAAEGGILRCIGEEELITIDYEGTNANIITLAATCTVDLNGHTVKVENGYLYPVFNGGNPSFINGTILNKWNDNPGYLVSNQSDVEIQNVLFNFDPIYSATHASAVKLSATCVLAGNGTYLINPTTDPTDYAAKIVRHYDKNLLFSNVNHPFQGDVTYFFTGPNGAANALAYAENGDTVYMNADLTVSVTTKLNALNQTITVIKESGAENFPSANLLISSAGDFEAGTPSGNSAIYRVKEASVCKLGSSYNNGTEKMSLSDAFTGSGTYITLLKDITLSASISPTSAVTRTLDLNGHTITFTGDDYKGVFSFAVTGQASNLMVKDTAGGGEIVHANGGAILKGKGGTTVFEIDGGTFRSIHTNNYYNILVNAKSFTVNGGTFITGINNSNPAAAICNNSTQVVLGSHTITQTGSDNGVYTYVVS